MQGIKGKEERATLFPTRQIFSVNSINIPRLENEVINNKHNHLNGCLLSLFHQPLFKSK